jgi:hypothetical protein
MSEDSEMRGILVDLKGGLDRIEGKIDSHTAWMTRHAEEHAAMGRQRGAATVWGKIAAIFASLIGLFNMPRGGH